MDLVTLLQLVPPLLNACIDDNAELSPGDDIAHLRALRLVNKECSGVAMLGLKAYILTLGGTMGHAQETNMSGVRLLRLARLGSLRLNLTLSASQSPALSLESFVRKVGACLSTVTALDLCYKDTSGSAVSAAELCQALGLLLDACPSINSLTSLGHLPTAFLRKLGQACPLLSALTMHNEQVDLLYLQRVLMLQPTLLPHVTSLSLPGLQLELPDMSHNTGILSLEMQRCFMQGTHWRSLPRNLQRLKCAAMYEEPPLCADSTDLLRSLLDIQFDSIRLPLHAVEQLLHKGPFPHQIRNCSLTIMCTVAPSLAADLSFIHQEMQMGVVKRFTYDLRFEASSREAWSPTLLSTLPRMTGVTQCAFDCRRGNLLPMLRAFPDAKDVIISHCAALGNLEMHTLAALEKLERLQLNYCDNVAPLGLLALCNQLRELVRVDFVGCAMLHGPGVGVCVGLLRQYGSKVKIYENNEEHEGEASESGSESD